MPSAECHLFVRSKCRFLAFVEFPSDAKFLWFVFPVHFSVFSLFKTQGSATPPATASATSASSGTACSGT